MTRPRAQSTELVRRLAAAGARPIQMPVIETADPADGGRALAEALARLENFAWVVFTSANAVERTWRHLGSGEWRAGPKVAAIGPGTAASLAQRGVTADLVPARYVAEALVEAFPSAAGPGAGSVLLPCAAGAREVTADGLRAKGWRVEVVEAYRTVRPVPAGPDAGDAAPHADPAEADVVTFTSSSAVTGYLELFGGDRVPPVVACIGPITARTAEAAGLAVEVVAPVHTAEGLVEALAIWAQGKVPPGERR